MIAHLDLTTYFREKDEEMKAKFKLQMEEKDPFFLSKLEQQVKNNGGYMCGGKVNSN